MKTKIKRNIFLPLVIFIMIFFIAGCELPWGNKTAKPAVPEYLEELAKTEEANDQKITDVCLYYDNTQSTYGFVQPNAANQTPRNFVIATDGLYNIMEGYSNPSYYRLDGSPNLNWQKLPDGKTFQSGYKTKDFYTYGAGTQFEGSLGPLQLLFSEKTAVNFDALNIFMTDMAEQNLQNSDLARMLNKIIEEKDDYSIALYAINSYFYGTASIPKAGVLDASGNLVFEDIPYDGVRPYYCLMVGPTKELVNFSDNFKTMLDSKGIKENTDFFSTTFFEKNGIEKIEIKDIQKTETIDYYKGEAQGIKPNESNETANLISVETDEIFDKIEKAYPCLDYEVDTQKQNPDNRNEGKINLFLPISKLEGAKLDRLKYSIDESKQKAYYTEKGEDKQLQWKEMNEIKFLNQISTSCTFLKQGTEVKNAEQAESPQFKQKTIYTVENEAGAIQLTINLKDLESYTSDYISVYIPVVANKDVKDAMPEWFNQKDVALKVENLTDFYKVLTGDFASAVEKEQYQEKRQATISDVVVNIKIK